VNTIMRYLHYFIAQERESEAMLKYAEIPRAPELTSATNARATARQLVPTMSLSRACSSWHTTSYRWLNERLKRLSPISKGGPWGLSPFCAGGVHAAVSLV
jgi:hypothetical protein